MLLFSHWEISGRAIVIRTGITFTSSSHPLFLNRDKPPPKRMTIAYSRSSPPDQMAHGLSPPAQFHRNSHSPVAARTSPTSPFRRVSASRGSDHPDNKNSGQWPGRYGHSMGFGSSNERGGIEEEAVDDSSPVDTPESQSTAEKRRKPALKLEEAGSSKKPRCMSKKRELELRLTHSGRPSYTRHLPRRRSM